ncbi:MAG: hypothetical protein U1F36_05520 [Planctomycetota bacterium]
MSEEGTIDASGARRSVRASGGLQSCVQGFLIMLGSGVATVEMVAWQGSGSVASPLLGEALVTLLQLAVIASPAGFLADQLARLFTGRELRFPRALLSGGLGGVAAIGIVRLGDGRLHDVAALVPFVLLPCVAHVALVAYFGQPIPEVPVVGEDEVARPDPTRPAVRAALDGSLRRALAYGVGVGTSTLILRSIEAASTPVSDFPMFPLAEPILAVFLAVLLVPVAATLGFVLDATLARTLQRGRGRRGLALVVGLLLGVVLHFAFRVLGERDAAGLAVITLGIAALLGVALVVAGAPRVATAD